MLRRFRPALFRACLLAWGGAFCGPGCAAYRTVAAPVKLTARTVVVASDTAGAVVSNGGRVAVSGVNALGALSGAGLDATSKLARSNMVTFVKPDGKVSRVPWREGLVLSAAASAGRVELAGHGVELIRDGRLIMAARHGVDALVAAGDVVRVVL